MSVRQRSRDMLEVEVFLFGGVPEGRHHERLLHRQLRQ